MSVFALFFTLLTVYTKPPARRTPLQTPRRRPTISDYVSPPPIPRENTARTRTKASLAAAAAPLGEVTAGAGRSPSPLRARFHAYLREKTEVCKGSFTGTGDSVGTGDQGLLSSTEILNRKEGQGAPHTLPPAPRLQGPPEAAHLSPGDLSPGGVAAPMLGPGATTVTQRTPAFEFTCRCNREETLSLPLYMCSSNEQITETVQIGIKKKNYFTT